MREILFDLMPVNVELLHFELFSAIGDNFIGISTDQTALRIIVKDGITVDEQNLIAPTVLAHDSLALTLNQQEQIDIRLNNIDIRDRILSSGLRDKSPSQIYTQLESQIDAWASLSEAKVDLKTWLPLMAAAIVWMLPRNN